MVNRDNRWTLAACTVAMAAAVGAPPAAEASAVAESKTVQSISNYCQASWRNAGIRRQEWSDCTQQAVAELIERISTDRLAAAVEDNESSERRELNRAVWRIIKRCRRTPHLSAYHESPDPPMASDDSWTDVVAAAQDCLSPRQLRILTMLKDGWRVQDIAQDLQLSAARVSDEKYKAVKKLRQRLVENSQAS